MCFNIVFHASKLAASGNLDSTVLYLELVSSTSVHD